MSGITTSDLQAVIAKWRKLIAELKEENALLDKARELLNESEDELRNLMAEWNATKSETQDAVMKVTAEITASRNEVAALEDQTAALNTRIAQRQEKTVQYKTILATKKAEVEGTKQRIFTEEEGVRQRLATFRSCREDLLGELEAKIAKVTEATKHEEETSVAKAKELERRLKQLEAIATTEKKQWEAERDRLDKEDKVACLSALRDEISAANASKLREASFLKDCATLKMNLAQSTKEIDQMLGNLRIDVA